MQARFVVIGILLSLLAGGANAQTCGGLQTVTNGTIADATVMMNNFNVLLGCINNLPATTTTLRGYIGGLTMSTDANFAIAASPGSTASDDGLTLMAVPVAATKAVNAAWSVGGGGGCLDTGNVAANTWYHLFVIMRADTGVVDELCSTSAMTPALPSGYSKKRRIGSFKTDASTHILNFNQNGDEFLWSLAQSDASTAALGTTPTSFPLSTPPSVITNAVINLVVQAPSTGGAAVLVTSNLGTSPVSNVPPGNYTIYAPSAGAVGAQGRINVRTDTARSIQLVSNVAGATVWIASAGWMDTRGRFN